MKSARFWVVALLLASVAILLQARGNSDLIPASEPLAQFPAAIGNGAATMSRSPRRHSMYLGPEIFFREFTPQAAGHRPSACLSDTSQLSERALPFIHPRTACRARDGNSSRRSMSI